LVVTYKIMTGNNEKFVHWSYIMGNNDTFVFLWLIWWGRIIILVVPYTDIMGTDDIFGGALHTYIAE